MMSTIATCVYFGCWKVRRARSSSAARPFAGASSNRLVRHRVNHWTYPFFLCVKNSTPPESLSARWSRSRRRYGYKIHHEEAHRHRALVGCRKGGAADREFQDGARFVPQHLIAHPSGHYSLQHVVDLPFTRGQVLPRPWEYGNLDHSNRISHSRHYVHRLLGKVEGPDACSRARPGAISRGEVDLECT